MGMNGCLLYSVAGEVLGSWRDSLGDGREEQGVFMGGDLVSFHCCPGLSHTLTFVCAVSCNLWHDELSAACCMPCGSVARELKSVKALLPFSVIVTPPPPTPHSSLNLLPSVHDQTITLPPYIMFLMLKLSILETEAQGCRQAVQLSLSFFAH